MQHCIEYEKNKIFKSNDVRIVLQPKWRLIIIKVN